MNHTIDFAHSPRPRIERLLVAQLRLRQARDHTHLIEVQRALVELQEGFPDAHTERVEDWANAWLERVA